MKRFALIVAALAMPLAGCAGLASTVLDGVVSVGQPAAAVGDKVVLEGTRSLILAHNAAQGAIAVVNPLVRNRVLTPAQVDRYEAIVNEVERLAITGRSTLTAADRATRLFNLADELNQMALR